VCVRVCNTHNKRNRICFTRLFVTFLQTILLHTTYQFMHDNIVKSSIASKIAQKTMHIDIALSKNANACTIMSTQSAGDTLLLFTIVNPFATMFVHVTFKYVSRCTSERVKILSATTVVVHVDCNPVFTRHVGWIGIVHRPSRFRR